MVLTETLNDMYFAEMFSLKYQLLQQPEQAPV